MFFDNAEVYEMRGQFVLVQWVLDFLNIFTNVCCILIKNSHLNCVHKFHIFAHCTKSSSRSAIKVQTFKAETQNEQHQSK